MTRHATSLPPSYFDAMYTVDPDPWQFDDSAYERAKYAATLAALPRERYPRALEVGCSIGVLTHALSARCDALLSLDMAEIALRQARDRCGSLTHVSFDRAQIPGGWADGTFDLILLSEVVYYLDADDVERLVGRVRGGLAGGGDVVLVHWTGETHYPLTGDDAAEMFISKTIDFLRIERAAVAHGGVQARRTSTRRCVGLYRSASHALPTGSASRAIGGTVTRQVKNRTRPVISRQIRPDHLSDDDDRADLKIVRRSTHLRHGAAP